MRVHLKQRPHTFDPLGTLDWLTHNGMPSATRGVGMGLDPSLRKQLVEAREVLLAEIDEVECRADAPFRAAPDYRDVFAELQKQLRDINEILEQDEPDRT
jgi:hypothetical protein